MELTVTFYALNPNQGEQTHYFFDKYSSYVNELRKYKLFSVGPDSFRFEGGTIAVASGAAGVLDTYKKAQYAIAHSEIKDDGTADFWECYRCSGAVLRAGKIFFSLARDYWGSFIDKASFDYMEATRCNRKVSTGVYDTPRQTQAVRHDVVLPPGTYEAKEMSCVALVSINTKEGTEVTEESAAAAYLVSFSLEGLAGFMESGNKKVSILMAAADFLGSVVFWKTTADSKDTYGASVSKAWIIPTAWISKPELYKMVFWLECKNSVLGLVNSVQVSVLRPWLYEKTYSLKESLGDFFTTLWPKGRAYVGTYSDVVELPRQDVPSWQVVCSTNANRLTIKIRTSGGEKDISDSFELPINTTSKALDATQQVAKWGKFVASALTGGIKGYMKGGAAGAGLSLVGPVADLIGVEAPAQPQVSGGDAFITYQAKVSETVQYKTLDAPIIVAFYYSVDDEDAKAYLDGLSVYSTMLGAWYKSVAKLDLFAGEGAETYIKGTALVSGVPDDAAAGIAADISQGIYYICLDE